MESCFVTHPPQHAFVAGCYWGDDSSWKIQYIDVSRIDEGIIKRDDRFGCIELPTHLSLRKAINAEDLSENGKRISISVELPFDITTGEAEVWDKDFYDKIVESRKKIDQEVDKWREYNERSAIIEADLKQRWEEQGERIRAAEWFRLQMGK